MQYCLLSNHLDKVLWIHMKAKISNENEKQQWKSKNEICKKYCIIFSKSKSKYHFKISLLFLDFNTILEFQSNFKILLPFLDFITISEFQNNFKILLLFLDFVTIFGFCYYSWILLQFLNFVINFKILLLISKFHY